MHISVRVESLPAPDNVDGSEEFLFLPTLSQLAFISQRAVFVWDAQDSKLLLRFYSDELCWGISSTSDGHVFACRTLQEKTYLWKESPTGYILHEVIPDSGGDVGPLLSPNGESVILPSGGGDWGVVHSIPSSLHLQHSNSTY